MEPGFDTIVRIFRTIRGVDQWGFIRFLVEMVCMERDREGEGEGELGLGIDHR